MSILVTVSLQADVALAQQGDGRLFKIVSSYNELTKEDTTRILNAQNEVSAAQAARSFTQKTDAVFTNLSNERLVNPKINAYKGDWVKLKGALESDPTDYETRRSVTAFKTAFVEAARGGKCTANVITGTKGATVRYAKSIDEKMGIAGTEAPGLTPTRIELERAIYTFRVFRAQRETGKRESVPCLKSDEIIDIDVNE